MGRLIDADALKQELYQQWFMDILLTQKNSEDMFYALAQKIDALPTAYDLDKVVGQLKYNATLYLDKDGEKVLLDDAIEIVKAGGINDNPD